MAKEEKAKVEKKKLIRVISEASSKDIYGKTCVYPRFSLMSTPNKDRKQCFTFQSCRDFVHEYVGGALKSDTYPLGTRKIDAKIDFTKLRLLIQRGTPDNFKLENFKEKLFCAKRVLNHYEAIAGWKPSVITTVKHDRYKHVWLLTGPEEWMSHPCLISVVTLIMRFISSNDPIEFKDQASLDKAIAKICASDSNKDAWIMNSVYKKLPKILKNYSKVFDRGSIKKAFECTNDDASTHGGGGILALCDYESIDSKANAVVKKMFASR